MRPNLFIPAFVCLCLYSTIFVGCQKREQSQTTYLGKNVTLVPIDSARKIAQLFNPAIYYKANNPNNHSAFRSSLNGNNLIKDYSVINDKAGVPALYIFNYTHGQGFIVVSADYQQQPVLAFIERGTFKKDTVPAGLIMWANKTVNNIELLRLGRYDNSKAANAAWRRIHEVTRTALKTSPINNNNPPPADPCSDPNYYSVTTDVVGPLLPVTWGQLCTYNESCPNNGCNDCSPNAATGCVATSVSQIINYWQPTNSFSYNYASMPTTVGSSEVQRLMSDVGTNVGMTYRCPASGGSSASGGLYPRPLKRILVFLQRTVLHITPAPCETIYMTTSGQCFWKAAMTRQTHFWAFGIGIRTATNGFATVPMKRTFPCATMGNYTGMDTSRSI